MQKILLKTNSFIKKNIFVVLFLFVFFSLTAYKITNFPTPFYDWDESIYAQTGREMISQKSYIVPLWQGTAWLDKPPLPSLTYGVVMNVLPFSPEIDTRLLTMLLSVIVLLMCYELYKRVTKDKTIATLVVVITSFMPSFLQRSQVLNVDVFLLIGWLGYVLFADKFVLSLFFLGVGVLSKSLLGFYPVVMFIGFDIYQFIRNKYTKKQLQELVGKRLLQIAIVSMWFLIMFLQYGNEFIKNHFYESHFKRVSASIESHFGKKTFYIDLLLLELGWLAIPALIGGLYTLYIWFKKRDDKKLFFSLFFVPWFIFLNLTKTKIAWYIYPIVHQFAFLSASSLLIFSKQKKIQIVIASILALYILVSNLGGNTFINTQYSSEDDIYKLVLHAKTKCRSLDFLTDSQTRKDNETLKSMDLLITSSEWWGNHPRVVYYFGKPVRFRYSKELLESQLEEVTCLALSLHDINEEKLNSVGLIKDTQVGDMVLFVK